MRCSNCRSAIATRRYGIYQSDMPFAQPTRIAPICDDCAARLRGLGMGLREQGEPVADTRPVWLRRRLAPKVMDHGGVA